jgi:hypothetical protein
MPTLHCHVLGFRPVPPQCRFAWPFVRRFGISSPVGLSSPVMVVFFILLCCNPVPWGGGPCSACCYFLMYAATATAHQLHIAACMTCMRRAPFAVRASSPLGWCSLFCFVLFLHACGRSLPAASRQRQLSSFFASAYSLYPLCPLSPIPSAA